MRNIKRLCEGVAGWGGERVRALAVVGERGLELVEAGWFPGVDSRHLVKGGHMQARRTASTYRLRNMAFAG